MRPACPAVGYRAGGCACRGLFRDLADFSTAFERVRVERVQRRDRAAKAEARAAEKAARLEAKKAKHAGAAPVSPPAAPKDDLFAAFQKAQAGSAEEMIAAFRARRASVEPQ